MADGCAFCDYSGPSEILAKGEGFYVIEPLNPVADGHLLVIPKKHVSPEAPDADAMAEVFRHAMLEGEWAVGGAFNLILSSGPEATQTVPHYHVHVVPRRAGDGLSLPWNDVKRLEAQGGD